MNAQQAPVIEASSPKNLPTEPKAFNLKQFSLPKASPKKTPSPPTEIDKSLQPKKPSPSSLLSTLKSFNIDRSKYKHYGHQSLMTSQSLETMMNEVHKNNIEVDTGTRKSFDETLVSPLSNKLIIDEKISQILDIPPQVLDEEAVWPYNIETLNEILRYKVEQEKTRQETIKCDFGSTAVELLKLAKSMGINSELIPFLFITNLVSLDSLKIQIQKLKTDPDEIINSISKKCNKDDFFRKGSSSSSSSSISDLKAPASTKRKHSDTHLPSFSETAESIRTHSAIVSPLRSHNTLPVIVHRRIVSDGSEVTNRASNTSSPPNQQAPLPLPNYARQHRLQQSLPQIPTQAIAQNMYPVYYPLQSGPSPPAHYQIPLPPQKTDQPNKALGSPYPPKYQSTNNAPQPASASGPPPIPPYQGQGYPPQQLPQYQYYGTSPTSLPHYMMQASPARMNLPSNHVPSQQHQPVPTHQFQKSPELGSGKSTVFKVADPHDDHTPNKKHKSSTKSNSINFMITTPKNPPARKYNNPHKEK